MIERALRPCYQQSVRWLAQRVRWLAVTSLVLLGGCPQPGGGSTLGTECFVDDECDAGQLCARDGLCWLAEDVHPARATWTVNGERASTTACALHPELYIEFRGPTVENLGFSPVTCATWLFPVDKLPRGYTRVELGVDRGPWVTGVLSETGLATLDLTF